MFGSFSHAVYSFYLILPLLSVVHAVTTTTATTAPTTAEQCRCPKAGTFVCAPGYAGQFCEITTTNPTDYQSSVSVAATPDSMYMSIDFSISKTGQIAVGSMKYGEPIKILDESLNVIKEFEVANSRDKFLSYGLNEQLYIGGSSNVVYVYNNNGDYVSNFSTNVENSINSIVGSEGLLYLTYYGLRKVQIYNEDGTYEASIEGIYGQPKYVTVTKDKIYVTSSKSYSIYDKNFTFLRSLPFNQSSLNFDVSGGGVVAVDNFGQLFIPDIDNDQLIVLDANYERVGTFGKHASTGQSVLSDPIIVKFSSDFRYFFTLERMSGMQKFEVPSSV